MEPDRDDLLKRFVLKVAIGAAIAALIPAIFAFAIQPDGTLYLGTPFNTDDHMVYAAWMKQAQNGAFFFDNRFTTDAQPKLTVHLYFWLLGLVSRIIGIVGATTIARGGLSFLFVVLLGQLVKRSDWDLFTSKFAVVLATFGGGLGFLVWHNYGRAIVNGPAKLFAPLFGNHLPIDVWQPEPFVFPSMLTNGLFMASLCLILGVVLAVLDSRSSWRPVIWGLPCMGLLMNIHSYDVLLLGLVLLGLLIASLASGEFAWAWLLRVAAICSGIIPAGLWFAHVLKVDPVFQARAETPTFSTGMPTFIGGLAPCFVVVAVALFTSPDSGSRRKIATLLWACVVAVAGVVAYSTHDAFLMPWWTWLLFALAALAMCWGMARREAVWNLLVAWATLGLFAPFIPEPFQRKLAAGLMIPYGLLGAVGLSELLKRFPREQRNLVSAVFITLIGATSVLWFRRELELIRDNVSTTTVQPAFLSVDGVKMVEILNKEKSPPIVVAIPGVPNREGTLIDRAGAPLVPDLNPIVAGLAGVYVYAGHWSETPHYADRRDDSLNRLFLNSASAADRLAFLQDTKAQFVISINSENYPGSPFADLSSLGKVVYRGNQFILVRME